MRKDSLLSVLLLGCVVSLGSRTEASSFTVNPIKVSLSGKEQSALLTLQNHSPEDLRFKIAVRAWKQSPLGEMQLQDTRDVVVFPGLLTLRPNEERKLRVGTTAHAETMEKSYRIFVEELPPLQAKEGASKSEVRVLTKMGIPIFIRPNKPTAGAAVGGMTVRKGKFSFSVKNIGNVHFLAQTVTVKAVDAKGAASYEKTLEGWYVLAGGSRQWEVEIPNEVCVQAKSLSVEVVTPESKVTERMDVTREGCNR